MITDPEKADKAWLDDFTDKLGRVGPEEEAFFERRRRLGLGVGLDEDGSLVCAGVKLDDEV
jgi:hypothetical protein